MVRYFHGQFFDLDIVKNVARDRNRRSGDGRADLLVVNIKVFMELRSVAVDLLNGYFITIALLIKE
jgi:hypothetical protein